MSHKICVDPIDDAGIDVSHLEQGGDLGVSGATIHLDHVSHPPVAVVLNDQRHACLDMQKNKIGFGCCNTACMVNRHTSSQAHPYYLWWYSEVKPLGTNAALTPHTVKGESVQ